MKAGLRRGALLLVFAAGGVLAWRFIRKPDDTKLEFVTVSIGRRDITATVNATANTNAATPITLPMNTQRPNDVDASNASASSALATDHRPENKA